MTEYRAWFKSATGQRVTADEIANILDVSRATATRRLMEGLDAGDTITVTRALRANPVQALVDLGHLTHAEALNFLDGEGQLVETADDGFLALALAKRLNPISKISEIDELAARRSIEVTPDVQQLEYVADDTDTEPEEGDEGYHDGP